MGGTANVPGDSFNDLTRETIDGHLIECLQRGGGTRPALLLIEDRGRRAIVKDYRPSGWLMRRIFGPWLIAREQRIYLTLRDTAGVPLKNRSNVVVADGLQPYIVDFASAFTSNGWLGPLRRLAFERFRDDDRRAVVKARMLVGGIRSEEDERFVRHRSPAERVVRAIRDGARWLFQLLGRL
jgi:hypothetical protein